MASLNKVQLIGNLGRDPELRYAASGTALATLSIATSERWKDKDTGEPKETTEWHRVVLHGRNAELAAEHLITGSQVYVEGALSTRKWTDAQNVERYSTEVRAFELKFLGGKRKGDGSTDATSAASPAAPAEKPATKRAAARAGKAPGGSSTGRPGTDWNDIPL